MTEELKLLLLKEMLEAELIRRVENGKVLPHIK